MTQFAGRKPAQLSGGQQQRVALARALVNHPEVLLLDEPLGALDLKLRREMQVELKRIQTEVGLTFIHVTHDQEEAMTMADTVAVMNKGHIEQLGAPAELYDLPRTRFVANFLGQANTGVGTIKDTDGDHLVADVLGTQVKILRSRSQVHEGEVLFGVRPEKVTVSRKQPDGVGNDVKGVVRDVSFLGVATSYLVDMPSGTTWSCYEQNLDVEPLDLRPGDEVWLTWNPGHAFGVPVDDRMSALAPAQVAGDPGVDPAPRRPRRTKRSWTAYLLLLPGVLWLGVFFLLPLVQLAAVSLQSRYPGFPGYYYRDLNFSNYASALTDYAPHFARSFLYAGLATFLAFVVAYPLAYAMAFKAGRWRNLMMICVVAPFFTSFILRTFAWSQILADEGWVAGTLNFLHLLPGRTHHQHPGRGHRGPDLQLPALHGAADLRLARARRPAGDRGRRRPLRQRLHDLPHGDAADVDARRARRDAADLHPGGRRLRQHGAARPPAGEDGRQRHQRPVPRHPRRLSRGGRAVVHADGRDPGDGLPLRTPLRHRRAGVRWPP